MTDSININSIEDLKEFVVKNLDSFLKPRQIILLSGEMGAGKTEFVKQLLAAAGSDEVTSPSFGLHHTYSVRGVSIEHLDLFRLASEDDLHSVGFWDLFENENSLIIVEWADRIVTHRIPMSWKKLSLQFEVLSVSRRRLQIS